MPDQKTTEITFSGHIVHSPESRELAQQIFNEQLKRFQEGGSGENPIDFVKIATKKQDYLAMNEFKSFTEETNMPGKLEQALAEFECGRAEDEIVLVKGANGEDYVTPSLIRRGLTQPCCYLPFVLREDDLIPSPSYGRRREERYTHHTRRAFKVKRGPGKGRTRSCWRQKTT